MFQIIAVIFILVLQTSLASSLRVGTGTTDITPPIETSSAGYEKRIGIPMKGVHDPLLATTLIMDNGQKMVGFCSLDNLGFTYDHIQEVIRKVKSYPGLEKCEIYIGSTHTHAGGGEFINIPIIGEVLAGVFNPSITQFYIDRIVNSFVIAFQKLEPAEIGFGYGQVEDLSKFRSKYPPNISPLEEVALIKFLKLDGSPLAALYNYPLHPTVLDKNNLLFSADFIGYTRQYLKKFLSPQLTVVYFNGAQAEIIPNLPPGGNRFAYSDAVGQTLADAVLKIWRSTPTKNQITITSAQYSYSFAPQPTTQGIQLPFKVYKSEINAILFDRNYAFITIPGELSRLYDARLKDQALRMGLEHLSILGLVNDAHGYIILPQAFEKKTYESQLSFGGPLYGEKVFQIALNLLKQLPRKGSPFNPSEIFIEKPALEPSLK